MAIDVNKCKKICAIVGAHFALAPLSIVWIYGNLSAYMNSYFHFQCQPGCLDADSQWILGLYVAGQFPGVLVVKPLVKVFGLRWTGTGAMVISNAALFASAWVLQHSVAWTAVVFGVLMGTCIGINLGVVVKLVSGWAPEWTAFLMATATSFPTFLSIVQNQLITAYVNPENLKVNEQVGKEIYFSQPQLLDRVPGAVIIIAAMTFGLQLIGYILISDPLTPKLQTESDVKSDLGITGQDKSEKIETTSLSHNGALQHKDKSYGANGTGFEHSASSTQEANQSINNPNHQETQEDHTSSGKLASLETKEPTVENTPISWKPAEVLQSPAFYAILFFGIALEFGILLKSNFYKEFGQQYIYNDRFLTLVGTLIPVTSIISRITLGTLMDKGYLTLKDVVVFGLSLNALLCFFWYIVPQVNAILYLFLVLGLAMAQCLFWVVIPTSALRLFGPSHLSVNFALVQASVFLSSFIMPIIVPPIIRGMGWFWLFTLCGIFNLGVLVYSVFVSFNTQRRK